MQTIDKLSAAIEIFCNKVEELRQVCDNKFNKFKKDSSAEKKILKQSLRLQKMTKGLQVLFLKVVDEICTKEGASYQKDFLREKFAYLDEYFKPYLEYYQEICKRGVDLSQGLPKELNELAIASRPWYRVWPEIIMTFQRPLADSLLTRNRLKGNFEEIQAKLNKMASRLLDEREKFGY